MCNPFLYFCFSTITKTLISFHHFHLSSFPYRKYGEDGIPHLYRRRLSATVVKENEKESQIFRDLPDAQPQGNLAKQLLEASSYREKRYGVVGNVVVERRTE